MKNSQGIHYIIMIEDKEHEEQIRAYCREVMQKSPRYWLILPKPYRDDKDLALRAVSDYPNHLGYLPASLRDDPEIVLTAAKSKWFNANLEHVSSRLRNKKQFVIDLLAVCGKNHLPSYKCGIPQFFSASLKDDEEIAEKSIEHLGGCSIEYFSSRIKSMKHIALAATQKDGFALQLLPDFHNDREVVISAAASCGYAINYAPQFQDDREIVLLCVKVHGHAIYHASQRLQKDREVLLTAIRSDPDVLSGLPAYLRSDPEVMRAVLDSC